MVARLWLGNDRVMITLKSGEVKGRVNFIKFYKKTETVKITLTYEE